jgi:hypothetical protein
MSEILILTLIKIKKKHRGKRRARVEGRGKRLMESSFLVVFDNKSKNNNNNNKSYNFFLYYYF